CVSLPSSPLPPWSSYLSSLLRSQATSPSSLPATTASSKPDSPPSPPARASSTSLDTTTTTLVPPPRRLPTSKGPAGVVWPPTRPGSTSALEPTTVPPKWQRAIKIGLRPLLPPLVPAITCLHLLMPMMEVGSVVPRWSSSLLLAQLLWLLPVPFCRSFFFLFLWHTLIVK
ncbi:MAG: hypothetical protein JOS17DRAFT_826320, partial [Linnemannia elongata]